MTPILETFSSRVYHMGPSGAGHVAKLLNNFLNGISLAATAEVMVAARKADLDLAQFLDVVNHSSGVNFATLNRFPRIVEGDYLEGGLTSELMAKDVRLYLELPAASSVSRASRGPRASERSTWPPRSATAVRSATVSSTRSGTSPGGVRLLRRREMRISRGRQAGKGSEMRGATFTGRVWADPVLAPQDGVTVNSVFFEPGARTHWHSHDIGQVLYVTHGEGFAWSKDGTGGRLTPGDVVAHPGRRDPLARRNPDSYMLHVAISLGGPEWLDPVSDDDYGSVFGRP